MKRNTIKLARFATALVAALVMLGSLSSCRNELELLKGNSNSTFTATIGCDIAGVQPLQSRASSAEFTDCLTNPSNASIIILLFDDNHILTNVYSGKFQETTYIDDDEHPQTQHIVFNAEMKTDAEPHFMHIIVNHPTLTPDNVPYGTESSVLNSDVMTVNEGQDVYWQRMYLKEVTEETISNALDHVALVRNYAKITANINLTNSDSDSGFLTMGDASASTHSDTEIKDVKWALMCVPTKGTVAPYLKDQEFAEYIESSTFKARTYSELYSDNYRCNVARTTNNAETYYRLCTENEVNEFTEWKDYTQPLYVFENEGYSDSDLWQRTAIIVKITLYNDKVFYYRVGFTDPTRNYEPLYLFRNIQYDLTITSVKEGMETVWEAYSKVAVNNVSGSAKTGTYTNVTYDTGALRVEYTKKYVLTPENFTLKARYISDISKTNGIAYEDEVIKNDCISLSYVGQTEEDIYGDDNKVFVIQKEPVSDIPEGETYCIFTFIPNLAQKNQLSTTQRIRVKVTDNNNPVNNQLYRNIDLILRERYMIKNLKITKDTDGTSDYEKNCFTLTVDIPSGLPKELFPLTFNFQSEPTCAYPNALKSIMEVEGTEKSIFDHSTTDSFVYHRDVSYDHYLDSNRFETKDGYTSITFFFKILDMQVPEDGTITFGVWNNAFSTSPDTEIKKTNSDCISSKYTFTNDNDVYTLSKSTN